MSKLSVHSIVSSDNLGDIDFNDNELQFLLECHEETMQRNTFMKHRLSLLVPSSNDTIEHKKQHKDKNKEFDELKDIKSKLETLQNVLKYLPPNISDSHDVIEEDAKCSGFLVVVGANIIEATRFYVELIGNILYLRREPNSKIKQVITISFIDSNVLEEQDLEEEEKKERKKKRKRDNGKYGDLFVAHLESKSKLHSFKVYSPTGIYVISASNATDRERFCKCIESELLSLFDNETWFAKNEASKQLLPMERDEFDMQMEQHQQILNSLTLTGLAHNVGLLGSTNKDKSGVMRILKHDKADQKHNKHRKWEDHFFVLSHRTLYYFNHDPEHKKHDNSMPKSFIPLKYGTLHLDTKRIKKDRFVFYISTPLRTIYLRCRHPVALSEWVAALKKVIDPKSHKTSHDILDKIRSIRSKVSSLHKLLKFKKGIQIFDDYLKEIECESVLRCLLAILQWKQNKDVFEKEKEEHFILQQYINNRDSGKECIWNCLPDKYSSLSDSLELDKMLEILDEFLTDEFKTHFVSRKEYISLKTAYDSMDKYLPMPLNREIDDFMDNSILILIITNSDLSQPRDIKLSRKKTRASIGRDCSNHIVLDDAHVSRSHARIQYDDHSAYFTDLGSHHGSYLNGNRVLYERLCDGDIIKIGQSHITFKVKNKKNIINKMFGKILTKNSNQTKSNKRNQSKHQDTLSVSFM